ncbi:HET-domain-containing protein [Daldinia decipiens]|uniref:HET-domain-containing protein n=1 Tax=Daldinia decipiens TaxID=326647 RepID=UPI0020C562D9|nr:HET-domain-containing protein [Daldinia decipiens]KAI1662261.1 HET-domain-containing protein [Daldinia decipiens]
MFRWHRPTCRRPDIYLVDDVLFCSSCDSAVELSTFQIPCLSTSSSCQRNSPESLDLRWPLSVQYSTDGERGSNGPECKVSAKYLRTRHTGIPKSSHLWLGENRFAIRFRSDGNLYPSLAQKYDIRLLRLSTSFSNDYLHGDLDVADLTNTHSFEALSYCWAGETNNNDKSKSIFIGAFWDIIPITRNCDSALRLLLSKGHLNIWVDSICIDQEDPYERSHQVSIMRDIYSKASQVLVYIGPTADDSNDAMYALNMLSGAAEPDLSSSQKLGLERLFKRRYFSRVWVIQEIIMARKVTLYCGDKSISWTSFSDLKVPYRYTHNVPWLLEYGQGNNNRTSELDGLLQLLDATSSCQASDPRDNVFAVLGLLRNSIFEGLAPDYLLSKEEVYIGIASYLILRHGKTEILLYPKGHSPNSLPTWVPDWSIYRPVKIPLEDCENNTIYGVSVSDVATRVEQSAISDQDEPNIRNEGDEDSFKLEYSHSLSRKGNSTQNIVWLVGSQTTWTLFTTSPEKSLRIRHFSKSLTECDIERIPSALSRVNAHTGALSIQSYVVTSLESFYQINHYDFIQKISFPGLECDFEWLIRTEIPATAGVDVVMYVPGCSSYLHLRRNSTGDDYSLIGTCRVGFRQSIVRTTRLDLPAILHTLTFANAVDINTSSEERNSNHLHASYGFDQSFMEFLVDLAESRLGIHIISHFIYRDASLSNLRMIAPLTRYFEYEIGKSAFWKTGSGWKVTATRGCNVEYIKRVCVIMSEQLEFWTRHTTWKALDAIGTCMDSMNKLSQMWSDWNKIAKVLAAIERGSLSKNVNDHPDVACSIDCYEYAYGIESQIATRLDLPNSCASLSLLVSTLTRLAIDIIYQVEFEQELFSCYVPGIDFEGEDGELSLAERVQLGRLYTHFIRSSAETSKRSLHDPLITLGTETFYNMVKSRIAILEWMKPSWESFQARLVEFRQICVHITAIDAFQEGISEFQNIVIV